MTNMVIDENGDVIVRRRPSQVGIGGPFASALHDYLSEDAGLGCCCSDFTCFSCCSAPSNWIGTEGLTCYAWEEEGPIIRSAEIVGFSTQELRFNPHYRRNPDLARLQTWTMTQTGPSTIWSDALGNRSAICAYQVPVHGILTEQIEGEPPVVIDTVGVSSDRTFSTNSLSALGPGRRSNSGDPKIWHMGILQETAGQFRRIGGPGTDARSDGSVFPNWPDEDPAGSGGSFRFREGPENDVINDFAWSVTLIPYRDGSQVCRQPRFECAFCR